MLVILRSWEAMDSVVEGAYEFAKEIAVLAGKVRND